MDNNKNYIFSQIAGGYAIKVYMCLIKYTFKDIIPIYNISIVVIMEISCFLYIYIFAEIIVDTDKNRIMF